MTNKTLTVRELIDLLEDAAPDALVVFASDYGDYFHTEQVHFLKGEISSKVIEPSAYSDSGWAIKPESEEDEKQSTEVWVIS